MEVQSYSRALRPRHDTKPPAKQILPSADKKTVSVATVFKRTPQAPKSGKTNPPKPAPKKTAEKAPDDKVQGHTSRSSSQDLHEAGYRVSKKKSAHHSLAVAFKNTTDDYRRHLFKTTTLRINTTLSTLTQSLYESSLQPISPLIDPQDSPIRLTIPAKFARAANKLYAPISAYKIGLTRTNTDGTHTKFPATLESRMSDYARFIASQKAEIEKLRDKWEAIVGEIWKVGVQVLGEEDVESLLLVTKGKGKGKGKEIASAVEPESSLFVAEQDSSPPARRTKKRVSFAEEVLDAPKRDLAFLYQPTRLRVGPVPNAPGMPVQEIGALERRVREMGQGEYAELKKAESDYKAYWQKKNQRLAQVLGED